MASIIMVSSEPTYVCCPSPGTGLRARSGGRELFLGLEISVL